MGRAAIVSLDANFDFSLLGELMALATRLRDLSQARYIATHCFGGIGIKIHKEFSPFRRFIPEESSDSSTQRADRAALFKLELGPIRSSRIEDVLMIVSRASPLVRIVSTNRAGRGEALFAKATVMAITPFMGCEFMTHVREKIGLGRAFSSAAVERPEFMLVRPSSSGGVCDCRPRACGRQFG